MTLIKLESGRHILIDVNIREKADDENHETPDVASMLRPMLPCDDQGRLYVDVFLLSHPDLDHCRGLERHFHLGPPEDCPDNKILIGEIWSSPMVFRRASKTRILSEDAKSFNREAKRRVNLFKETRNIGLTGNRIQILGEDENGKTDGLGKILVRVNEQIQYVNGQPDASVNARLLGPLTSSEFNSPEEAEEILAKNNSSVIIHFLLSSEGRGDACAFLTGGDSEVVIWEKLWEKHGTHACLTYDLMQAPHHCSWHSLSRESWSRTEGKAEMSLFAQKALSQAQPGAFIVASSKPIEDDYNDPPCIGAKRAYKEILNQVGGEFICTGDKSPELVTFEVTKDGIVPHKKITFPRKGIFLGAVGRQPLAHG